ncbi:hypothetical protein [Nocardiopsis endophytica]|nr:hypothetical protein [Nocardiopsis endophytica]
MFEHKRGEGSTHRWWWIGPILAGGTRALVACFIEWWLNSGGPS